MAERLTVRAFFSLEKKRNLGKKRKTKVSISKEEKKAAAISRSEVQVLPRALVFQLNFWEGGCMGIVEYGEFKGNKVIKLRRDENDQFGFTFGKGKARLIVENFEEIKKFAEEA